ncbi:MAG: AtpZ/AtpI family protein [Hyphomicrobiaceae bacterium]
MSEPTDQRGRGDLSPEERAVFERRVQELDQKLDRVREAKRVEQSAGQQSRMSGRGMAYGFRMVSELVAAVLVGGIIGYGLDYALGTGRWLFLAFLLLGFVAGIVNLLRAHRKLQDEISAATGGDLGRPVADNDDD